MPSLAELLNNIRSPLISLIFAKAMQIHSDKRVGHHSTARTCTILTGGWTTSSMVECIHSPLGWTVHTRIIKYI